MKILEISYKLSHVYLLHITSAVVRVYDSLLSLVLMRRAKTKVSSSPTGPYWRFLDGQYLVPWPKSLQCLQFVKARLRSACRNGSEPTHILVRQSVLQALCDIFLECLVLIARRILLFPSSPDSSIRSKPSPLLRAISSQECASSLWSVGRMLSHGEPDEFRNDVTRCTYNCKQ